ncbi:MAG: phosphotransferase family protein, partial [Clostridia bacterium]
MDRFLPFRPAALSAYLSRVHEHEAKKAGQKPGAVSRVRITPLGGGRQGDKGYGYGIPLRVDYELGGKARSAVIESVRPGPFGHEHRADRAQQLLWAHDAFGRLPRHAASLDVGAVRRDGSLVGLGDADEFFILMERVEGREYAEDLLRIRAGGELLPLDIERGQALCDYLARIHNVKPPEGEPAGQLYERRIRELIGHGECLFGVCDSYPDIGYYNDVLSHLEARLVGWRWRLKRRSHRLCQVHGDFHPWNILFRENSDFSVLDRSRGEWGDAADDVACLTMNYLFFSLQRSGRLEGPFEWLYRGFWERYLERSGDREMFEVVAPFFAFRAVVMANPLWYPAIGD